jgi:hypothetical protein
MFKMLRSSQFLVRESVGIEAHANCSVLGAFFYPVFPAVPDCHKSKETGAAEAKLQCTVKKDCHFHFVVDRN